MIEMYVNARGFLFRRGATQVGTMPFETLEVQHDKAATEEDKRDMKFYAEEFFPGEVYKFGKPARTVILGPTKEFTHEVTLRAAGNPDKYQYADIGPRKTVRCCSIEEAQAIVNKYQATYEMGGGNCSKEHGVVWQLPVGGKGRRKSIGRVHFQGNFQTHEETAKWEAEIKAKYAKKEEAQ